MTSTPDGRLFVADVGGKHRTVELTPGLEFVRSFDHPVVAELTPFANTSGVAHREGTAPDGGRLWWLNKEDTEGGTVVERVLLLEGTLDGVPTGRRVEVPVAETAPPPSETGAPVGLAYDGALARFFYLDFALDELWAVDTLGALVAGYPVEAAAPERKLGFGHDVHRGVDYHGAGAGSPTPTGSEDIAGADALWWEVGTAFAGDGRLTRIVALRADGSWSGIETPVPLGPSGEVMRGAPVRSRVDPNGALYYPISTFGVIAVVAVRPHPLPPTWLVVGEAVADGEPSAAWEGELEPGESRTVRLEFRAGTRAVGAYEASLQVFEAATGAAVEVPLSLEVTPGTTDAEEEAERGAASGLSVYPNPSAGAATVTLTLAEAGEVRVSVVDVLGREVAVLHDGLLTAGSHELKLTGSGLPSGLYVVRVVSAAWEASRRFTLVR